MKRKTSYITAGLALVLLCLSQVTSSTSAAGTWEDNFEGPPEGWTFFGWSNATPQYEIIEGNFTTADGTLKVRDDDINIARHSSTVTVGNWSFDLFIPEDYGATGEVYVWFMSNGSRPATEFPLRCFMIGAWFPDDRFYVIEWYDSLYAIHSQIDVDDIPADSISGWHHIDVSRNSTGYFEVYFNGTFVDDFVGISVTSSTYLEFLCNNATGAAIDNIVVSIPLENGGDGVIDWPPIIIGVVVAVAVIALVVVFLRRR